MSCSLPREELDSYLDGRLGEERRLEVEQHIETCDACQGVDVFGSEWNALFEHKLPRVAAPEALRERIVGQLEIASAAASSGTTSTPIVDIRTHWYRRMLASSWVPRVAMVAILAFLMLVPALLLDRTPLMAKTAVARHDCHAPTFGLEMPPCCADLMLAVGDAMTSPAAGAVVPDLDTAGLSMVTTTRCSFDNVVVNQIAYRTTESAMFSLYISDQVAEQFMQIRTESADGVAQARHRLAENDVTIWERDGLIYLWVGPHANPEYETALAALMNGQ